jgi:hypothetical protein
MLSIILWGLGIGASVTALVITAALKPDNIGMAYAHMAIAAGASIAMALIAIGRLRSEAAERKTHRALKASVSLHYMGLVWGWAMLALFATYAFVLQWREWWHFVLAFTLLAGVCLWLAVALRKDARSNAEDDTLLTLARIVTIIHLGAGVITMLGLIIDGKMVRFLVPRHQDWAAQNIFFFGAFALAAISWSALAAQRSDSR